MLKYLVLYTMQRWMHSSQNSLQDWHINYIIHTFQKNKENNFWSNILRFGSYGLWMSDGATLQTNDEAAARVRSWWSLRPRLSRVRYELIRVSSGHADQRPFPAPLSIFNDRSLKRYILSHPANDGTRFWNNIILSGRNRSKRLVFNSPVNYHLLK